MKKAFTIAKEVISWVVLVAVIIAFAFTVYTNITNENDGEGAFLLGYRPVLVLTGSMEPYMMTNSIAITKEVTEIDELALNDVITYHVENEEGKLIRITHRIIAIDGEHIYTKGDNNQVSDGYPLTMENVEAKVVCVVNATAWLVAKWNSSTAAKVMLISFAVAIVLFYFFIKSMFKWLFDKFKASKAEPVDPEKLSEEGTGENALPDQSEEAVPTQEPAAATETETEEEVPTDEQTERPF